MPIYEFGQDSINRVEETTFNEVGLLERRDLQRLLREHLEVIAPDTLIISEEFGEWEKSRRRVDLLGVDKSANLVVIELKRTEDGGHMELQAIRYASMVSTMTFEDATAAFVEHLTRIGKESQGARGINLKFLGWDEPDELQFAQDVQIILASAEFSRELTSSVLWLIDHGIDIRCVRLKPYSLDGRLLVDVQQIIPLPEVGDYLVHVREKAQKERQARERRSFAKMPELIGWGIIKTGDKLKIKGRDDSEAEVVDAHDVIFKGETLSYNNWGQKVTGWSTINIYDWAVNEDGKTLAALRAAKAKEQALANG